ncbi:FliM/FliN family flagellar motor C-terminal domain-containing protein [Ponticoccus litoralis]|uniref:FliM/FliN family flagellar motor C-terminal domain-containing protein n=1 Tax=Ponticoccus litoralis TaxID=422297 RepID=A0AAW9SFQ8_9RHOB
MADGGRDDILGQKAQAAQRAFEARGMSLAKALRRALSRTADVLWDLALVTQSVAVEMLDQDGVVAALTPGDLLLLLDGPDGALGLVLVDRQVMTGLIEVQTIQQVTQMPLDTERVLTPTDAAMMAPLLDGALDRLADSLAEHPLHGQLQGYRFGAMVEDARTASLLLDGAAYRVFTAEVDLALGRRRGVLKLILPERKPRRGADAPPPEDLPGPHEALLSRVPAKLDAVLTRVRLPLNRARALKPGDLLPLASDALGRVEVMAGPGHLVARGRLGKINGLRAVRLTWPVAGGGRGMALPLPDRRRASTPPMGPRLTGARRRPCPTCRPPPRSRWPIPGISRGRRRCRTFPGWISPQRRRSSTSTPLARMRPLSRAATPWRLCPRSTSRVISRQRRKPSIWMISRLVAGPVWRNQAARPRSR